MLEGLFDKKVIAILKAFFQEQKKRYYLQELAKASGVSLASSSRILSKLARLDLIEVTNISRFKLYSLKENERVEFLGKIFKQDVKILDEFVVMAKDIPGIESIILHGKERSDRANILLIGENIDPGEVKALCARIKEEHGYAIAPLSLTREQYMQMSQMGLYSGQKKVLYGKSEE